MDKSEFATHHNNTSTLGHNDASLCVNSCVRRMLQRTAHEAWPGELPCSDGLEELHQGHKRTGRSCGSRSQWTEYHNVSQYTRRKRWQPSAYLIFAAIFSVLISPTTAALVNFQNCLPQTYQDSGALQFVPQYVDAVFNTTDPAHNLRITVWGNVTGAMYLGFNPPPPNDPYWSNPLKTDGKITNTTDGVKITTLRAYVDFLNYRPWTENLQFCSQIINGTCPLAPSFASNPYAPSSYPALSASNNFYQSYAFTSLTATFLIINGNVDASNIGCISAEITPDLGSSLSGVLGFIPLLVLVFVGIATAFASIFSPWGTSDVFRWTSNYGRDADLLRLVTPGFGDCLQYIQFVALTGGLTLSYPGYYQPVTSKVAWSALMFNESFVTKGKNTDSLIDGIYVTNGTYGLDVLSQLVGMRDVAEIWAGMVVWLLSVLGVVMALIQLCFLLRWIHRKVSGIQEEDLREKNMPFSVGNVIRIVFSYFLLPIVAFSMFQLVTAGNSPSYTVAFAAILLVVVFGFTGWLVYVVISTRPRSYLFDDLPTVLIYGPLYNTYSDNASAFALVPVFLTIVRGIAIGAVQPSGIAQLVLLAICEVITILTLHSFRPFHSPTSMNAYHTFFSVCRLASVILMVAFAPPLGVSSGPKGWIGYAILLLHAVVLLFAFFLNAIQTIVEVAARMAGAGGDESGAARGGFSKVFGMRQLSRRLPRVDAGSRQSNLSGSVMLDSDKSGQLLRDSRIRSQSAGSTGILLNRPRSAGFESADPNGAYTPTTLGGPASTFSFLPGAAAPSATKQPRGTLLNLSTTEAADPYYRPPRSRRPTVELSMSPGARSRASWTSGDWANKIWSQHEGGTPTDGPDPTSSVSGRGTPVPAYIAGPAQDPGSNEARRSQTDYTTREVDFYYGVRGPALNANVPGRRLRTGPVDPTNNAVSIGGFFKGLLGGKTKEKGKGFEVVRSSRMPPGMKARSVAGHESPPEGIPVAAGVARNGPIDSDDEDPVPTNRITRPEAPDVHGPDSDIEGDDEPLEMQRISDVPPSLPGIDVGAGFEVPSRIGSRASAKPSRLDGGPMVPRRSSRRLSQKNMLSPDEARQLMIDHPASGGQSGRLYDPQPFHRSKQSTGSGRLPFERSHSKPHSMISTKSSIQPTLSDTLSERPTNVGHVNNHSVTTITPDPNHNLDLSGRSAEIVDSRGSTERPHSFEYGQAQ